MIWKNPGSTTAFSVLWESRNMAHAGTTNVPAVALADLDNDGSIDIITGNYTTTNSTVYAWKNPNTTGITTRAFGTGVWSSTLILSTNTGVNALFIADLDSSTNIYPDIIIGGENRNLQIVKNPGTTAFTSSPWPSVTMIYSKGGTNDIYGVWAGRIDSDNTPDIVTGAGAATAGPVQEVHIFKNPGFASAFDSPSVWDSNPVANLPVIVGPVALADLDKDGSKDIVLRTDLMHNNYTFFTRYTAKGIESNAISILICKTTNPKPWRILPKPCAS